MNLETLQPDDYLVVAQYGVGQCKGWSTISKQKMLSVFFILPKAMIYFPQEKLETLPARELSTSEEMEATLRLIPTFKKVGGKLQLWRKRESRYYKKMYSGDLKEIAEVMSETYMSNYKREGFYNRSENDIYKLAINTFAQELMIVQHLTYDQAIEKIQSYLR